jgi:tRNA pseudouridine38-40 synthase
MMTALEVGFDFHARSRPCGEISMTYRRPSGGVPASFCLLINYPTNRMLRECAGSVLGEHDFTALCRATAETENKICTVYESGWEWQNDLLIYSVTANRFLHSMVRMLVGSMLEVARGKYPAAAFKNLLGNNSSGMQVYTAPAQGLILWNVKYLEEIK